MGLKEVFNTLSPQIASGRGTPKCEENSIPFPISFRWVKLLIFALSQGQQLIVSYELRGWWRWLEMVLLMIEREETADMGSGSTLPPFVKSSVGKGHFSLAQARLPPDPSLGSQSFWLSEHKHWFRRLSKGGRWVKRQCPGVSEGFLCNNTKEMVHYQKVYVISHLESMGNIDSKKISVIGHTIQETPSGKKIPACGATIKIRRRNKEVKISRTIVI